jgi:hypothetical protein
MSTFLYEDADDGLLYELRYIVTQSDDEGPEYVEWRVSPKVAGSYYMPSWQRLPSWAMPPKAAMEFWHGEITEDKEDGLTMDDVNDLLDANYRLITDLKRLGILPKTFEMLYPSDPRATRANTE